MSKRSDESKELMGAQELGIWILMTTFEVHDMARYEVGFSCFSPIIISLLVPVHNLFTRLSSLIFQEKLECKCNPSGSTLSRIILSIM